MRCLTIATCLTVAFLLSAASAKAQVRLRVCNDGKIPVYAAVVSERGQIWPLKFHGWEKIEPGNRNMFNSCWPFYMGGTGVNEYYILFGIYDRAARFGVIAYKGKIIDRRVCVPAPGKKESDCENAPASAGLQPRDSREIDMTFDVKPDIDEPILVYLEPGKGGESSPAITPYSPPERTKGILETLAEGYNEVQARRVRVRESCRTAYSHSEPSKVRTYCTCMGNAVFDNSDWNSQQIMIDEWSDQRLGAARKFGDFRRAEQRCPGAPELSLPITRVLAPGTYIKLWRAFNDTHLESEQRARVLLSKLQVKGYSPIFFRPPKAAWMGRVGDSSDWATVILVGPFATATGESKAKMDLAALLASLPPEYTEGALSGMRVETHVVRSAQ